MVITHKNLRKMIDAKRIKSLQKTQNTRFVDMRCPSCKQKMRFIELKTLPNAQEAIYLCENEMFEFDYEVKARKVILERPREIRLATDIIKNTPNTPEFSPSSVTPKPAINDFKS